MESLTGLRLEPQSGHIQAALTGYMLWSLLIGYVADERTGRVDETGCGGSIGILQNLDPRGRESGMIPLLASMAIFATI